MTNIGFTVKMLSDWHVGTGAGRHRSVDRLVRRDADGLPYIPGKTIKGIWRDACECVAVGLDDGNESGVWSEWVRFLFGTEPAFHVAAVPGSIRIGSAYYPTIVKQALHSSPFVSEAVTFVRSGIRIDRVSGRAEDNMLRFIEIARAGSVLEGDFSIIDDGGNPELALALLAAGARFVENLGAKTRRGWGKCTIGFDDDTAWNNRLTYLEADITREKPLPRSVTELESRNPSPIKQGWTCFDLRLALKEPLSAGDRTVGNVARTLSYLPGTSLLPMVLGALRSSVPGIDAAARCGDLVVTNATISVNDVAGLPVPRSFAHAKNDEGFGGGTVINVLTARTDDRLTDGQSAPLKPHARGFLGAFIRADRAPLFANPEIESRTHNVVDNVHRRPTSDVGGVYTYDAIGAHTVLRAQLRMRSSLTSLPTKELISKLAHADLRFGTSASIEYGATTLHGGKADEIPVAPEVRSDLATHVKTGKLLVVWFVSDMLLRDARLRPSTRPEDFCRVLGDALGLGRSERLVIRECTPRQSQNPANTAADSIEGPSWLAVANRRESWQGRWGLARPTLIGIAAGSVAVLDIPNGVSISDATLKSLELSGVGERRGEGYGQLRLNPALLLSESGSLAVTDSETVRRRHNSAIALQYLGGEHHIFLRSVQSAAWRAQIVRAAEALGAPNSPCTALDFKSVNSRSQLGGLRAVMRHLTTHDATHVTRWLRTRNKTVARSGKWKKQEPLRQMELLLEDKELVWVALRMPLPTAQQRPFVAIDNDDGAMRNELWAEAVRTLVFARIRAATRGTDR